MAKDEINAFLGSSTVFNGSLNFSGTVRVDGRFIGEIISDGTLIVGREARIEGKLNVNSLVLSGNFNGESIIREKALFQKTGVYEGSMISPVVLMEEGCIFQGELLMKDSRNTTKEEKAKS
ncbi:MAG: bactofilin family protein [Desulfovibrionaceae bacterium]